MNNVKFTILSLLLFSFLFTASNANAQVTIGSDQAPVEGALLDLKENQGKVENSTKGLLLPRVELYHLKRLKMGDFEITDITEKLAHTGLVVYHIPPANESTAKAISPETMSDTSIRQDIEKGVYYWDGKKWGKLGFDGQIEKPMVELSVTPDLITFNADETATQYYTVIVNEGSTWAVSPTSDANWTITPSVQAGTIAINPKAANTDISAEKTINLTVTASKEGAQSITANISAVQKTPFVLEVTPTEYTFAANELTPQTFAIRLSSGANWSIATDSKWTINPTSGIGSGTFTVAPKAANTSSNDIVFTPTITATRDNETKTAQISLTQKGVDYSADLGLPNCYIVSKADTRFTIPIKKAIAVWKSGNWKATDNSGVSYSLLPEAKDVDLMENLTARVLWYDTKDVVKSVAIEGTGADRNMILNVSGIEGNTVVALYGDKGEILWSWHIWSTDQPAEQRFALMNNYIWMDRNLGATETTTAGNGSTYKHKGLLYQWGRKDPFSGSNSYSSTTRVPIYVWNGSGYTTISSNYPTKASSDFGSSVSAQQQRLQHTITNPIDFITTTSSDWYAQSSLIGGDASRQWNDRWGGIQTSSTSPTQKSVMDPCPEGWRVPYPTKNSIIQYSPWGETFSGVHESCTALSYGGKQYGFSYKEAGSTSLVFYPTTGQLSKTTGQMQVDDGSESGSGNPRVVSPVTGTYWNSGNYSFGKANTLFIANPLRVSTTGSGSTDGQFTENRASGAAVRCIKDTSAK